MHKYLLQTNIYAIIFITPSKIPVKTRNINIQTIAYLFLKFDLYAKNRFIPAETTFRTIQRLTVT